MTVSLDFTRLSKIFETFRYFLRLFEPFKSQILHEFDEVLYEKDEVLHGKDEVLWTR